MADSQHCSELQLLALLDEELPRKEANAALSHLTRCFPCHRLYEGLRRETDLLRAAAAPDAVREREPARELGWVVAAGLLLSFGLVALRRFFAGVEEAAAETSLPDALPVLSDLGFRLLSGLDIQQLGLQFAYGGIVIMTLFGIALASRAIRRPRAGVMPVLLAALLPGMSALSAPAEALEVIAGDTAPVQRRVGRGRERRPAAPLRRSHCRRDRAGRPLLRGPAADDQRARGRGTSSVSATR